MMAQQPALSDPMPGVTFRAYQKRRLPKTDRRTYQKTYHATVWRRKAYVASCAAMSDEKLQQLTVRYREFLEVIEAEIKNRAKGERAA